MCFDTKWEISEHQLYYSNWIFAIRKSLLQLCPLRNNTLFSLFFFLCFFFRFSFIESIFCNLQGLEFQWEREREMMYTGWILPPPESIISHHSVNSFGEFTAPKPKNHFVRHILKTQNNFRAVSFVSLFYLACFLLLGLVFLFPFFFLQVILVCYWFFFPLPLCNFLEEL